MPPDVAKKYDCAVRGEILKQAWQHWAQSKEFTRSEKREERTIIEPGPSMTAENVILAMKTNKQAEASDPLNLEEHQASNLDEVVECLREVSVGNIEQAKAAAAVGDVDVLSAANSSDVEQQPLAGAIPAAPKNKKCQRGSPKNVRKRCQSDSTN